MHAAAVAPARRAALRVLARIRRDKAYSGPVLAAELERAALTAEDAGLATRLSYGVVSAEGVLDEAIDRHLHASLEPRLRDVLRLAAYELLFTRAPAYAVVDQAVSAARDIRPQAAGLVNAVARRLTEDAASFPWGDPAHDREALARASATPRWIVDAVLEALGDENGRAMLGAGLDPAPTYVRLDPFAQEPSLTLAWLTHVGAQPASSPPDEDCFRLARPAAAFSGNAPRAMFAMDAAAQLAPAICRPHQGLAVLDACAGRGNKTVCLQAIAVRRGGPAQITAADLHIGKVEALRSRIHAGRIPAVTCIEANAAEIADSTPDVSYDVVLLDAPCTGLGTLRRYPEKRWRLQPGAIERMAALQSTLLRGVARVVRPGGCVVYSTCSISSAENAGVVQSFLAEDGGQAFSIEPVGSLVPDDWAAFIDAEGCFGSWPASGGPDGHYVAVIRRGRG